MADLAVAEQLLGEGTEPLVSAALAAEGCTLESLERRQVLHRPGHSLVVRYAAAVAAPDGTRAHQTIVAVASSDGPPPGTLVLEADGLQVGLFRYPHDPSLPGLALLVDPDRVGAALGWPRGPEAVEVTVRTYRPLQRAVAHVRAGAREAWVKALPPAELADAVARHADVAASTALAPRVLESAPDTGLLALTARTGRTVKELIADGTQVDPQAILDVVDQLAGAHMSRRVGRAGPLDALDRHATTLAHVLPVVGVRLERLVERLLAGPRDDGPEVGVHGDLHPGQLLAHDGAITGVLDLDDAGTGHLADDLGCYLAHVACAALDHPAAHTHLARCAAAFEARVGAAPLRRRTAAAVVAMATGPYRVQQVGWEAATAARIALAERWAGDPRTGCETSQLGPMGTSRVGAKKGTTAPARAGRRHDHSRRT